MTEGGWGLVVGCSWVWRGTHEIRTVSEVQSMEGKVGRRKRLLPHFARECAGLSPRHRPVRHLMDTKTSEPTEIVALAQRIPGQRAIVGWLASMSIP